MGAGIVVVIVIVLIMMLVLFGVGSYMLLASEETPTESSDLDADLSMDYSSLEMPEPSPVAPVAVAPMAPTATAAPAVVTDNKVRYGDSIKAYNYYSNLGKGYLMLSGSNSAPCNLPGVNAQSTFGMWKIAGKPVGTPVVFGDLISLRDSSSGKNLGNCGPIITGTCVSAVSLGGTGGWYVVGQQAGSPLYYGPGMKLKSQRTGQYLSLCGAGTAGILPVGTMTAATNSGYWKFMRA